MVPYYLLPGLVLALVAASLTPASRLTLVCVAAAVCSWLSYCRFSPWVYYISVMGFLVVALVWSWPTSNSANTLVGDAHAKVNI
jgi:hypothetical protein